MSGTKIISGDWKGLEIRPMPKNILVRPILARIKKSLFDILTNHIQGCRFLDLFAGSGSVGIEALSRGAARVVFVESHFQCRERIQQTLETYSKKIVLSTSQKDWVIYARDIRNGLNWLNEDFDLIFSGAPYKDEEKKPIYFVQELLKMILQAKILKKQGTFVAQHHAKERFEAPEEWNFFRAEKYGDSTLSFFKLK
ncbi:MAG: 16S rRNA (guanine(966)-N(2))-methyltransferase RsmD [Elusimicrobia bacterium RIFCSPHIGHO2_02_FULL_39_36]|nr:MAG: 16S rRNA (guanine(966)-N(2))-methyltransferase RsmD [Elusimicrobia bacterium GWA2_38_7]OGR78251.1 MAG: 16S rRNA (guanine(966)-N(2))-methyltransferase RsmD [Elusimicrobia bacterium RIFCSPHIGHO2_02_FULL_39_36]OGR98932.1 MAG: 16S rRNA (guanine(966)-N(2))-methyltransferase RsmD [Elusimicrobia bacterium RIFCSPLOWO2_12_FULL_39_28]